MRIVIYFLCNLAWLSFIFIHSAIERDASSAESDAVLSGMNRFLSFFGLSGFSDTIPLRKLAHFFEHAVLGLFFSGWVPLLKKKISPNIVPVLFGVLFCAIFDETVQLFAPGRSAEVVDVWIDLSGGALAVLLFFTLLYLVRKKKKGKDAKDE